jgi:hypothetical protein
MIEVNRSTIVIAPPPSNENSFYHAIGLDRRDASIFGAQHLTCSEHVAVPVGVARAPDLDSE